MIGGWTSNDGQFRSLLVGVHRGDQLVYVGRVGTGFGADTVTRSSCRALQAVESDDRARSRGANAPRKEARRALG